MTAPNKSSSPTRTRDRVLQTLYEIDIGGEELEQVLEKHSLERSNTFYKEMIRGIISDKERIDILNSMNIKLLFCNSRKID